MIWVCLVDYQEWAAFREAMVHLADFPGDLAEDFPEDLAEDFPEDLAEDFPGDLADLACQE